LRYALRLAAALGLLLAVGAVASYGASWDAWDKKDHEAETKCKLGGFAYDPSCAKNSWGNGGVSDYGYGAEYDGGAYGNTASSPAGKNFLGLGGANHGQPSYYESMGAGAGYGAGVAAGAGAGARGDAAFFDTVRANTFKPIVLCRQKGCTTLNDKMTESYLFNSIANLLYINDKTKVYLCEADTSTRACTSTGLKYAVNIGGTAGVIHLPSMTITEVTFAQNLRRVNFMLSYDLYANGVKSFCTSAHSTIEISSNKQALIRDNNYKCQLTSDLPSTSYNIYNIDYVDLDYGIVGAYYSIGMSGASSGGASGYVLMKFQYTDTNFTGSDSKCGTGSCASENYRIAPGQYEVVPVGK
jgi:hypothetical protein